MLNLEVKNEVTIWTCDLTQKYRYVANIVSNNGQKDYLCISMRINTLTGILVARV